MENLKKIISVFIKKPANSIEETTLIDKTVIQGSILIHRMYSELAEIGYPISNYSEIHTFGELLSSLELSENKDHKNIKITTDNFDADISEQQLMLGIDIEEIQNFNSSNDYREDLFYKQNFSDREISYCLMQPNILHSFAGKFAAKEAIVKADNQFQHIPFNQIEILNDDLGKPYFKDFYISVSHSNNNAVAVAIKNKNDESNNMKFALSEEKKKKSALIPIIISVIAISISIISLFIKF